MKKLWVYVPNFLFLPHFSSNTQNFLTKLIRFIQSYPITNSNFVVSSYSTTLLFLFSAALCDSHFNFQMAWVCLQMRAALVTTVYRKTLSVSSTLLSAKFSIGEIVNFMSTDADRIVNSCPSFHALWSIPFQVNG